MAAQSKSGETVGYLELLRVNAQFRLLWGGQVVSLLGDWFNLIASASLIAVLTQSGAAVGGLFVVRMLAPFLVSPIAGVAADRYNRKHLLIWTDVLRGITVLFFLLVRSPELVWLVYVITAIQMSGSGFFFPARNSILPDITSKQELGAANALSATTWSVMLALGAALGGFFSGIWGVYPAFILDAFSFFLSGLIISRMTYDPPAALKESDKSVIAALRQYVDGLNYLRQHVDILVIAMHKAANGLFVFATYQVLQVTLAEQYFPMGEGSGISLGLMYAITGVGTGVGPIAARYFTGDANPRLRWAISAGYVSSVLGLVLTATLFNFPVVLVGAFFTGVGGGIVWVLSSQLLMQMLPLNVRGRVFSTEFMMATLGNAIGAGSVGILLDTRLGVSGLLYVLSACTIVITVLWHLWMTFGKREKLKPDEQPTMA